MSSLHHPNIIGYYDSFIDGNNHFCIVMQYAHGGTLHEWIRERRGVYFEEKLVFQLFAQMALCSQ
jgi:serine/threonine protein kinase